MLSRLVNIMVSLELRYVQERAEDGQLMYKLDPWALESARTVICVLMPTHRPVDSFVIYDGKRAADIAPPRYAVRHLVATEVSSRLTLGQTFVSSASGVDSTHFSPHRSMLSSLSVMRRPLSERKRQNLLPSSATQERLKMQMRMIPRKRKARGCSCRPPLRTSHHGSEIRLWLQMWMPWKRSALFPFSHSVQHRPGIHKYT